MATPSRSAAQLTLSLNAQDNVSRVTDKVEKRISRYEKAVQRVKGFTSGAVDHIGQSFTNFSVAAFNSIVMLQDNIVNPLKTMILGFSQTGFSLEKMARNARLSVDALGALGFAAEQTGSNTESVASALQTMEDKFKEAGRGSVSAMQEIYGAVGQTYAQLKDLSPEERFLKIADIIRTCGSEADKADMARKMFGSDDLLPLLRKGREGIRQLMQEGRDLGAPWSNESVQKSKELANAFNRIKTILEGIKTDFLTGLADYILENLELLKNFISNVKIFIQENPDMVKGIALVTGGIVAVVTAAMALVPVIMGVNVAIGATTALLTAFLNPWILIPTLIVGGLAAFLHFTGGLEDLRNSISAFFSSMLENVGASSSSLTEIVLAGWFAIQKNLILIWVGLQSVFIEVISGIQLQWNSFRKNFQAGINYLYGKVTGLSDEEIEVMTRITNEEFDAKKKEIEKRKNDALTQNTNAGQEAITNIQLEIKDKIAAARRKADEENSVKIQMKEQQLNLEREKFIMDASDPSSPEYISEAEGNAPAHWLRSMVQDSSKGTQNSFQAMFGMGQTNEQKQLEVTRQIFQILQALQAEGAIG